METIQALLTNERYHSLLNGKDLRGRTPFIHACKEGQEGAVAQLLLLAEERLEGIDFNEGFVQACRGGHLPVVNRLKELAIIHNIDTQAGLRELREKPEIISIP